MLAARTLRVASPRARASARSRRSSGFTLIELLVAMSIATVVSLAAFSIITFATQQVLHNAERGDAQQRVRIALENLMLELHSGCVSAPVTPLRVAPESKLISSKMIRFVSNSVTTSTIEKPALHVVEYNTEVAGNPRLIEKEYVDANGTTGTTPVPPNWTFAESTPTHTRILLTHVLEATERLRHGDSDLSVLPLPRGKGHHRRLWRTPTHADDRS